MPSGFANSADKLSAATRGGDLSSDSDETSASEREAGQSRKSQESRWEDCFQRLLKFREEHGNCLVPYRYKKDPQLGKWVSSQRTIRNGWVSHAEEASPLLRERARRLEAIGFQWSSKDPRHVPWEQRYEQLADFVVSSDHQSMSNRPSDADCIFGQPTSPSQQLQLTPCLRFVSCGRRKNTATLKFQ